MAELGATPGTLNEVLGRARAGDSIILAEGSYAPLRIFDRKSIVIDGLDAGRVVFDGGVDLEKFGERAAQVAWDTKRSGMYPGVYPIAYEAALRIEECSDLELRNITFQNCWPTAVYIRQSSGLALKQVHVKGSTYAIYAVGHATRDLTIADCTWTQDETLWSKVPWEDVHEDRDECWLYGPERAFDGSFFNGSDIAGDVEIARCEIKHAFNGVHLFNHGHDPEIARNVHVHHCKFHYIRDNPIEPEQTALNWWIHDNEFFNCHKWFSLELRHAGWIYIFRNRGWFTGKPGPKESTHRNGSVFKLNVEPEVADYPGPIHVFNNSWYLRTPLLPQGAMRNLHHHNNAIVYCSEVNLPGTSNCDQPIFFFGDLAARDTAGRFTKQWSEKQFNITFKNDCVLHPEWPGDIVSAKYPDLQEAPTENPKFAWSPDVDYKDRFKLETGSPCRDAGKAVKVDLPDGSSWEPKGKFNIGWHQETENFGPTYRPLPR